MSVSNPFWSITLIDKFEVRRPDGSLVRFRTRKAESLVALLALNNGKAIPRTELANQLWPGADRVSQMTSFRQALLLARSAFADGDAIESDRSGCRLNLSSWKCDAIEVLEGRAEYRRGSLLPAMTEDAFDEWRIELACASPEGGELSAAGVLPTLFDWALAYDPPRVLEIAHATPELLSALPLEKWGRTLSISLESAKPNHSLFAWGNLQLANIELWQGQYDLSLEHAKAAMRGAENIGDSKTLTGALFAVAYLLTMRGRWTKALDLLDSGRQMIDERREIFNVRRLDHAFGHAHAHAGDVKTALYKMVKNHGPEPEFNEEVTWTFRASHRSCYLAIAGKTQQAWQAYEAALAIAQRLSHPLVNTQVLLAKATTLLAENEKEKAFQAYKTLKEQAQRLGSLPTATHALEAMGLASDDPAERANYFAQADLIRRNHNLPLLPLDRIWANKVMRL